MSLRARPRSTPRSPARSLGFTQQLLHIPGQTAPVGRGSGIRASAYHVGKPPASGVGTGACIRAAAHGLSSIVGTFRPALASIGCQGFGPAGGPSETQGLSGMGAAGGIISVRSIACSTNLGGGAVGGAFLGGLWDSSTALCSARVSTNLGGGGGTGKLCAPICGSVTICTTTGGGATSIVFSLEASIFWKLSTIQMGA